MDHDALAQLLVDRLDTPEAWQAAINALAVCHGDLIRSLEAELEDEGLLALLSILVIALGRIGFRTPERKRRLFEEAQAMDVHVLPVHYSSPVPDTRAIPASAWARQLDVPEALELDPATQAALVARIGRFAGELAGVPEEPPPGGGLHWRNGQLPRVDATVYYCLLRELRPARVLEVGGGYSTVVASRALAANGAGELVCVEPYPEDWLRRLPGTRLVEARLEDVEAAALPVLEGGDVLFVDGTHVARIGSDVVRVLLELVPGLPRGAVVHVHDVFTPFEYPRAWVEHEQQFWNEQYLLEAFLLFNREWEVLCLTHYLGVERPDDVRRALALAPSEPAGGASAWIRRRAR